MKMDVISGYVFYPEADELTLRSDDRADSGYALRIEDNIICLKTFHIVVLRKALAALEERARVEEGARPY